MNKGCWLFLYKGIILTGIEKLQGQFADENVACGIFSVILTL